LAGGLAAASEMTGFSRAFRAIDALEQVASSLTL
jgi:hypothetical protein